MPSVMRKSPISGISYVPYDAGIASIWNISVQRGTGPSRSGSTMAECVGHAHSSRDGSAISSIPLPADAALMTGGLEWRGACRHLRPRQIRTGIGSTAEPGSRLGLGASTSTRDVGMRWANGGRWFKVIGPNAAASKDIVCSLRWCWPTGSKGQAQRLSQPVRRHDGWQLAFTGSPAMRLIMATRTDRCRLRLGWETIAARRKGKATVMRYFTTDTHFGHPLVTVLRGFTTFDPTHSRYEEVRRA